MQWEIDGVRKKFSPLPFDLSCGLARGTIFLGSKNLLRGTGAPFC